MKRGVEMSGRRGSAAFSSAFCAAPSLDTASAFPQVDKYRGPRPSLEGGGGVVFRACL